jgi:hypothetical protein
VQAGDSGRAGDDDGGVGAADGDGDERKLADLGLHTIEMFTISHIFSTKLQAAFQEEQARRCATTRSRQRGCKSAAACRRCTVQDCGCCSAVQDVCFL